MTNASVSQSGCTYLLVHGAWHGAWCWYKVIPLIQARGHKAIAIELPGHSDYADDISNISLDDYAKAVVDVANKVKGKIILVGHSMSGIVISQAAERLGDRVSAMIYLDAFLPRNGDTLFSLVEATLKHQPPGISAKPGIVEGIIISDDHKTNSINPELASWLFYHDCPEEDKNFALPRILREPIAPLATPLRLTDNLYGSIPKYFILCTESRDMNKAFLSTHVPCEKIYNLASGHSPFFSMPEELVDIFIDVEIRMGNTVTA